MAETLRDGVQVLASSQADWIKSLASARGFFRGSQGALPPVEVKQLTVHAGEDGSNDDGGDGDLDDHGGDDGGPPSPAPSGHWMDQLAPTLIALTQQIMPLISTWANKSRGESSNTNAPVAAPVSVAASPAAEAGEDSAEHVATVRRAIFDAVIPGRGVDLLRLLQRLPPSTTAKINAVQARLDPADRAAVIQILQSHGADGLNDLLPVLERASLDEAAGFLRRLAADWRVSVAEQQAARARAATSVVEPLAASTPLDRTDAEAGPKGP